MLDMERRYSSRNRCRVAPFSILGGLHNEGGKTMITWHDLTKGEQSTLVSIGLEHYKRLHKENERGLFLLAKGLIKAKFENNTSTTYTLTEAGRQVLLAAPTDTGMSVFPLPSHIQQVKQLLRGASAEQ
jgi:hypothetical protein